MDTAVAMLVIADTTDEEPETRLRCSGRTAADFSAAFIMDFPEAIFLYKPSDHEDPKRIFLIERENGQDEVHPMSFSILKQLVEADVRSFRIACE